MLNLHDFLNLLDWCKQQYDTWHYTWDWGNYDTQTVYPYFNIVNIRHMNIRNLPQERKALMNTMLEEQHQSLKMQNYRLGTMGSK